MNYDNLHTTVEILEAFQGCRDAGEQIDLFEALAWRDEPPVEAFIEIVRKIKLEPVLALATQALGWVKNAEVLERLKKSEELLEILSNLAKSGATDLIKWSAAKSIIAIGFDFIAVSQHLTEMPSITLERIVDSKKKVITDFKIRYKSDEKITERSDYKDLVSFWVYGSTYDLRILTSQHCGETSSTVVSEVVMHQMVHGIKETNKLLQRVESSRYSEEFTKNACENELFERFTHLLSAKLLYEDGDRDYIFVHLILNQGHSLQSNDSQSRFTAASIILNSDKSRLNAIESFDSKLLLIAKAISVCSFDLDKTFSYENMVYEDLAEIVDNLRVSQRLVSRKVTSQYLTKYFNKLSRDLSLLSPGFTWKQIMVVEEIERQKKKDTEGRMREEAAKKEAARQAEIKAKEVKKEAAIKAEEVRKEAARQSAEKKQTEKKQAESRAETRLASIIISTTLAIPVIMVLSSAVVCISACLNSPELAKPSPLWNIPGGMLISPLTWFGAVATMFCNLFGWSCGQLTTEKWGVLILQLFGSSLTWGFPFWWLIFQLINKLYRGIRYGTNT
jgi:hypothetical protein